MSDGNQPTGKALKVVGQRPIRPDGVDKVTGRALYNVHATGAGVAYHHSVTAHFDADRGAGQWITTRTCDFTFARP